MFCWSLFFGISIFFFQLCFFFIIFEYIYKINNSIYRKSCIIIYIYIFMFFFASISQVVTCFILAVAIFTLHPIFCFIFNNFVLFFSQLQHSSICQFLHIFIIFFHHRTNNQHVSASWFKFFLLSVFVFLYFYIHFFTCSRPYFLPYYIFLFFIIFLHLNFVKKCSDCWK